MKKNGIIIILFLLICGNGCNREKFPFDARGLTFKGLFVYESQFRIDGFYYHINDDGNVGVRYFFKDGSSYSAFHGDFDIESIEECPQIWERTRDIPYFWGFYIVEGDIIRIQTLDPTSLHRHRRFMVQEERFRIENDSTIRFFKRISPEGRVRNFDIVFHFRQCENKPDSMNILLR